MKHICQKCLGELLPDGCDIEVYSIPPIITKCDKCGADVYLGGNRYSCKINAVSDGAFDFLTKSKNDHQGQRTS